MLIRFSRFGCCYIGRGVGFPNYDARINVCFGKRDAPASAPQWRYTWSWSWDWLPVRIYRDLRIHTPGVDSIRWTGRDRKFLGFGRWRSELKAHRSNWRSKVFVYLTGAKERANPKHIVYVAPAGDSGIKAKGEIPSEWIVEDKPRTFSVEFNHGRASVDDRLGAYMVGAGIAQRTNLVRAGSSLLGSLASTIAGR